MTLAPGPGEVKALEHRTAVFRRAGIVWRYGVHVLVTTITFFLNKKGWRRSRNWLRILGY